MSRLFLYLGLSLAAHFFAVFPLLAEQFAGQTVVPVAPVERPTLALPKLVTKALKPEVKTPLAAPSASVEKEAKVAKVAQQQVTQVVQQPAVSPSSTDKPQPPAMPKPARTQAQAAQKTAAKTRPAPSTAAAQHTKPAESRQAARQTQPPQPASVAKTETTAAAPRPQATPAAPGAQQKIISKQPRFARQPSAPTYPASARRRQQQGTVWLDVELDARGKQIDIQILRSSGVQSLDQAALAAVQKWQFLPEQHNGVAVASRVHIPVAFALAAQRY